MNKKFWIIWTWNISKKHIEALIKINQNVWVYDINPDVAEEVAIKYELPLYKDIASLISNSDYIAICTPHNTHAEIIKEVVSFPGKICICEKPLCLNPNDFSNEFMQKFWDRIFIVYQNRLNSAVIKAKTIIDNWLLWDIIFVKWTTSWHRDNTYYTKSPWRGTIEGEWWILFNQWIHNIDIVLWLMNWYDDIITKEITYISKEKIRNIDIETEDCISFWLKINWIMYHYTILTYWNKGIPENSINIIWTKWSLKIGWWALNNIEFVSLYEGNYPLSMDPEEISDIYGNWHYKFYDTLIHWDKWSLVRLTEWIKTTQLIREIYNTYREYKIT